MLGQLSRKDETDAGLDLAGGDGGLLRVRGELCGDPGQSNRESISTQMLTRTGSLGSNALEDIVHERVENGHSLV